MKLKEKLALDWSSNKNRHRAFIAGFEAAIQTLVERFHDGPAGPIDPDCYIERPVREILALGEEEYEE